LQKISLPTQIT